MYEQLNKRDHINLTNFTKEEHQLPFSTYDLICIYAYKNYLKRYFQNYWEDDYDRYIKETFNKSKKVTYMATTLILHLSICFYND